MMIGTMIAAGARLKTLLVGGGRDDVFLVEELDPVGERGRPTVEAARIHGPEPVLEVRHDLVLGVAADQRADRARRQE